MKQVSGELSQPGLVQQAFSADPLMVLNLREFARERLCAAQARASPDAMRALLSSLDPVVLDELGLSAVQV